MAQVSGQICQIDIRKTNKNLDKEIAEIQACFTGFKGFFQRFVSFLKFISGCTTAPQMIGVRLVLRQLEQLKTDVNMRDEVQGHITTTYEKWQEEWLLMLEKSPLRVMLNSNQYEQLYQYTSRNYEKIFYKLVVLE